MAAALTTETLKSVWHAVGLELVIFSATLVSALLIRIFSNRQAAQMKSPKIICKEPNQKDRSFSKLSDGTGSERPRQRSWSADAGDGRIPRLVHFMEDVVQGQAARDNRSAARSLAAYAEVQSSLEGFPVHEVARHCRHGPLEFYTALMQCALRAARWHVVPAILDDMTGQDVARPLHFYESLMKQLAGQKQYRLALDVYERLAGDGLQASPVTCSCIVSFAVELGDLDRAVTYFKQLSKVSTPSIRAYMTVLRVHGKRRDWRSSVSVLRDMRRRGVAVDSLVLNVIMATGVAADQLDEAEALLVEAPDIADTVSYNTLMKGYSQRNQADKALEVLKRMRLQGRKPNAISFNTAMDAFVRCGRFQDAWAILADMRTSGALPDKFSCSILVKGLAKDPSAEQVDSCLDLLKDAGSRCEAALRGSLYLAVVEAAAELESPVRLLMQAFAQLRQQKVTPTATMNQILLKALEKDVSFGDERPRLRAAREATRTAGDDPQDALEALLDECFRKRSVVCLQ